MIIGYILAILFALVVFSGIAAAICYYLLNTDDCWKYEYGSDDYTLSKPKRYKKLICCRVIVIILCILLALGACVGFYFSSVEIKNYNARHFIASCEGEYAALMIFLNNPPEGLIIEQSELMARVFDYNEKVSNNKVSAQHWSNCFMDKNLIDQILELPLITY